ncbi:MAG: M1 family metallopeptidase [Cytophagales bacterium]|nr:M1 family metallopeptidase [Cytophagales bacterium]
MKFLNLLLLLAVSYRSLAQKEALYEPIEYKKAYENGTRLRNGLPGKSYWQNSADYVIKATFDPSSKIIKGNLSITYMNNSPDSLNLIVFKLMHNIYKKGAVRQIPTPKINLHDGVQIENLTFNGKDISKNSINIAGTVMKVRLPGFLKKNSRATIDLDFITPLPKTSGYRCGTVDSTSFFAAYWFPQVAVYDDIFGWDLDEYVGFHENYNDFSSYLVELTLPSEYNVWATGEHLNVEEIFSNEITKKIVASKFSKKPIVILDEEDFRQADGKDNTWVFKADNVPDFAWGASDHYVWEGVAVKNPNAGNTCWVQSAYPVGAKNFDLVIDVAKKSVETLSTGFPGMPYPYFKHISFRGTKGGGMEFPMLANNNVQPDTLNTIVVTAHEIAHNYFPFMMGINERKYGWWDETMTILMESYVRMKNYPKHKLHGFFNHKTSFSHYAPHHEILPLITESSHMMKQLPIMVNNYVKGPAAMDILANIIGAQEFYDCTKEFMQAWAYKHPTPYDFFYFINNKREEHLNWFWDAWFFSYGYPDIAIVCATQNMRYLSVHLENTGGLPVPFRLTVSYMDGTEFDEDFGVEIWREDLKNTDVRIPISGNVEEVKIDNRYSYDAVEGNNAFLLKK